MWWNMIVSLSERVLISLSASSCTTLTSRECRFTYQLRVESVGLQPVFRCSHSLLLFFIPLYCQVIGSLVATAHCGRISPSRPPRQSDTIQSVWLRQLNSVPLFCLFFFPQKFKLLVWPLLISSPETNLFRDVLTVFVQCSTIPHWLYKRRY